MVTELLLLWSLEGVLEVLEYFYFSIIFDWVLCMCVNRSLGWAI